MYDEIDVTTWQHGDAEQLGTKPKQWMVDGNDQLWLWKEVTWNARADGSSYAKGDDWSERVATAIADRLELPAAVTELAVDHRASGSVNGVLSRNVLASGESLILGNALLADVGVNVAADRVRAGYTLDAVRMALRGVDPPVPGELTAWDWWVGYLVLDALIGNTDRHQENWAVISDGNRRLAPTYDHASCLGFMLDDVERDERLTTADTNRTVVAYARRATTKFEGRAHPCAAAAAGLARVDTGVRDRWLDRVRALGTSETSSNRFLGIGPRTRAERSPGSSSSRTWTACCPRWWVPSEHGTS